ncbi:sensor histidine kinase [Flavilitoribacter nigricans]|uniref:Signal transduction histidine kinase internal region domain-containing protein n=1 Tax=Flavilitoribacter nigricans (strain ATCC 23147 / DSM 23189 / NBRC 102662 / NCIMB 1420 / SS-2) TaxID=1122177 RepID=A0A2D0NKC7_FLAN2|nr:sensor histidine kinase [Flavilitoribacter nigricans]PHN08193.1 hypothetical protein CRP01_02405 [Flavilitoribacter nigricans DSM 23189 = NBRC 102662]
MKRKGIEVLLNLLFWGVTAWFILTSFAILSQEIEIINEVETVRTTWSGSIILLLSILLVVSAGLFYFNLWNITRLIRGISRTKVFAYGLGAYSLSLLIYRVILALPVLSTYPKLSQGLVFSILLFYFAVSFGYGISKVWLQSESRRQQLELEKKQAELDRLRSHLQPHFLFNVLNNLMSMVDQHQHPKLADSIDRLSGLLRHVVYDSGLEQNPVEKEIDFIRNYAELQLLRFEAGEVDFILTVEGDHAHRVEPGIFLPFIENAFKHGAAPEEASTIQVHFDLSREDRMRFSVSNPILPALPAGQKGGTGLKATRHRLELVYPDRHQLTIASGTTYRVDLELVSRSLKNSNPAS